MCVQKRQQLQSYTQPVPTPASISGWPECLVSAACRQVATDVVAQTTTSTFLPTSTTILAVTATGVSTCVAPAEDPAYTAFTPVWGVWDGDSIPFSVCVSVYCGNTIHVGTDGYLYFRDTVQTNYGVTLGVFYGQSGGDVSGGMYVYSGMTTGKYDGIFYRVAGAVGTRSLVVSYYIGTRSFGNEQNHYNITLFEDVQVVAYKYYG
ncbi:hypothetical protein LTR97_012201 [Elasticomyces elasticus]|uniref:Uncharacterized protein n=1 Tax=Elasticomyces elasticus TaxID=574655 RepID=A0AAN7VY26_9PEZI|nr:hypothetical protein LTR97_012201 [Elasticomyces elasticus]